MLILKCLAGKNRRVTIVVGSKNMWKAKIAKVKHRQPNVMVACAQAHVAQAMDCIVVLYYGCLRTGTCGAGDGLYSCIINTTIQSIACATCACAQATITLGCLWVKRLKLI